MKKIILPLIILTFIQFSIKSQQSAILNVNNINTIVQNNLSPFYDPTSIESTYEVVLNSGIKPIFKTGLSFLAKDINDSVYISTEGLFSSWYKDNFGFGPIADDYNSQSFENYDQVWKVTSQEIWGHQQGLGSSYSIMNWPAHGDTSNGEAFYLAPFVDVNGDGIYSPSQGDYPKIKGDEAIYFIVNDKNSNHVNFYNHSIGIEIHVMIYSFNSNINTINNTTFVNYSVYNRSSIDFVEFYSSPYLDADLQCAYNDFHGCDSLRNTVLSFEGKDSSTNPSYTCQDTLIRNSALALRLLNKKMYSSFYNGVGTFSSLSTTISVTREERLENLMLGLSPFGDSLYSFIDSSLTHQVSPNGINQIIASDSILDYGGDPKINAVIKTDYFPSNSSLCFDIAYVYYQNDSLNNIENASQILLATDTVQDFYDNINLSCIGFLTNIEKSENRRITTSSYPNPAVDQATIDFSRELLDAEVNLQNSLGQIVRKVEISNVSQLQIERKGLESGVYFYSILEKGNVIGSGKIVFE